MEMFLGLSGSLWNEKVKISMDYKHLPCHSSAGKTDTLTLKLTEISSKDWLQ